METEIWKDISGYKDCYQVSDFGRVKSLSRFQSTTERILKGESDNRGYIRVRLSTHNETKKYQVHRLVSLAFIPNPENKLQINHISGITSDNHYKNLEWCTQSENMIHAFKIGLQSIKGEKNHQSKLTEKQLIEIRDLLKNGTFHKDIAIKFNVSRRCITDINLNKTWAK